MSPTITLKDLISNFIGKYFSYLKGKSIENPNLTKSILLHLFLLFLISGMLPTCTKKIEAPKIIAVDIMPLGQDKKTIPKTENQESKKTEPQEQKPQPPKEVKKPEEATKMEKADKPQPMAKPEEKKPTPKKIEKKPELKKDVKKQEQQKKDEKDQEGKKKLLKNLEKKDQAALENIFDKETQDNPQAAPVPQNSGKSEAADAVFVNELMGKIQSQISQCWNIPIGAKDVQNTTVELYIALTPSGNVTQVKIIDQLRYSSDNVYRVLADSAVWAVKECSPLHDLPPDKYDLWKEIEFSFDPSAAL